MTTDAPPTLSDAALLRRAADQRFDDAEALERAGQAGAATKAERDASVLYRWASLAAKHGGRCPWQAIVTYARAVVGG